MGLILGIVASFVPVLVIGGIIAAVVILLRRRQGDGEDPGIGTLKRLYFYTISFAALMALANGFFLLVDSAGDMLLGEDVFSHGETQLALGLALSLVGVPIWLFYWRLSLRAVAQIPWETQALARRLYLHLVLTVSAAVSVFGFVGLFRWWLGVEEFDGRHIAMPVVWGLVWAFHWRQVDLEKQDYSEDDGVRPLYVYAASMVGLVMLVVGLGSILQHLFSFAYGAISSTELMTLTGPGVWNNTMGTAMALAVTGGVVWSWHWHWGANTTGIRAAGAGEGVRQVYLYIFTIFPGSTTVVVSLSIVLFRLISWWLGSADFLGPGDYFRALPNAIAVLVAGGAVWGYHWAVAKQESAAVGSLPEARRAYRYLVSGVALGAIGVGLVALLGVGAGTVFPLGGEELASTGWWHGQFALAMTLLALGVPLWGFHWLSAQRQVISAGAVELVALPRRVFVYSVFGVAVLIGLISLSWVLFLVFKDVLEANISIGVIQQAKLPLGMALVAGSIGFYHWLVLQEDRRALAESPLEVREEPKVLKNITALIPDSAQPAIRRLEEGLGYAIRTWKRLDGAETIGGLTEEELDNARRRIADAPGDQILVSIDASGIIVVPYRDS